MVSGTISPRYGDDSATAPEWSDIEQRLTDAQLYWLVTVGADGWGSGKDISVEGVASRVEDEALLPALTEEWRTKYDGDWVFEARDGRFFEISHQGAGGGGAVVFRVPPRKVLVFGDEHGQTTFRF